MFRDIFNKESDENDIELDTGTKLWLFGRLLHFLKLVFKLIF